MIGVILFLCSFFSHDNPLHIAESLAQGVIAQEPNMNAQYELSLLDKNDLKSMLNTDDKKKAFWINVYNGMIFNLLSADPTLYNNRSAFFKNKNINVAGEELSFDDIEHGILRKSTWKYSLGYLPDLFKSSFVDDHQVQILDPRIHFAINCGAKSCPPVSVYKHHLLDQQLNEASIHFLKETTDYYPDQNKILVTTLIHWFRGDFDGIQGALQLLKHFDIIPHTIEPDVDFSDYDWTIDLNNVRE